ncbi:hypothetical protein B0H16DRAFT_1484479 [Mycena metata]|uniref:F-box domain-containing protein n=1 Tax=Mycena metata TaxID=1033252 RepID=A0AAD7GPS6_9AGAR|nr:hypothetical protein B0H16DRAFT_1484479 [Mycena metata]
MICVPYAPGPGEILVIISGADPKLLFTMLDLPNEMLSSTLKHLTLKDLLSISATCRRLEGITEPLRYSAVKIGSDTAADSFLQEVKIAPQRAQWVKSFTVTIDRKRYAPCLIRILPTFTNLQVLDLVQTSATPEVVGSLGALEFANLRTLRATVKKQTLVVVSGFLRTHPHLTEIVLKMCYEGALLDGLDPSTELLIERINLPKLKAFGGLGTFVCSLVCPDKTVNAVNLYIPYGRDAARTVGWLGAIASIESLSLTLSMDDSDGIPWKALGQLLPGLVELSLEGVSTSWKCSSFVKAS